MTPDPHAELRAAQEAGMRVQGQDLADDKWHDSIWKFNNPPGRYRIHPDDVAKWEAIKAAKLPESRGTTHHELHAKHLEAEAENQERRPCVHCGHMQLFAKSPGLGWHPIEYHDCKETQADPVRDKQVGGSHYKDHAIQPWDIIDEYGLDFYEGCALKYLLRSKDPAKRIEDLKKAIHCIEKRCQILAANGATIG